jgi:protein gp37
MAPTRIPWATDVLPFWSGCSPASPGCDNCWAERTANRLQRMHVPGYERGFELTLHPKVFEQPMHWRRPRLAFVCPTSDFFHPLVPTKWRLRAWDEMATWDQHTYLLLTKRPEHIPDWLRADPWPDHIWLGVSVENDDYWWRVDEARRVPALHRFISFEPLLGLIGREHLKELNAGVADWCIVGAESGPGRRACRVPWVGAIVAWARGEPGFPGGRTPVFVKQLDVLRTRGIRVVRETHHLSKNPEEWPKDLRVQEFPAGLPVPGRKG